MSFVSDTFNGEQLHRMATMAYGHLIKYHETKGMQNLVDYMESIGFQHDASNNQLTFWARASRSPHRDRIILDMPSPLDFLLEFHHSSIRRTIYYVGYYLNEQDVARLQREIDNAPDKVADAREILTDRANDQDPALRGRPLSIDISQ